MRGHHASPVSHKTHVPPSWWFFFLEGRPSVSPLEGHLFGGKTTKRGELREPSKTRLELVPSEVRAPRNFSRSDAIGSLPAPRFAHSDF